MGVHRLWQLIQAFERDISSIGEWARIASAKNGAPSGAIAIDAAIWIEQLRAVANKSTSSAAAILATHGRGGAAGDGSIDSSEVEIRVILAGFLRRLLKLLDQGVLPVVVFDGPAPALKLAEQLRRRELRSRRDEAQMRHLAERLVDSGIAAGTLVGPAAKDGDKKENKKKPAQKKVATVAAAVAIDVDDDDDDGDVMIVDAADAANNSKNKKKRTTTRHLATTDDEAAKFLAQLSRGGEFVEDDDEEDEEEAEKRRRNAKRVKALRKNRQRRMQQQSSLSSNLTTSTTDGSQLVQSASSDSIGSFLRRVSTGGATSAAALVKTVSTSGHLFPAAAAANPNVAFSVPGKAFLGKRSVLERTTSAAVTAAAMLKAGDDDARREMLLSSSSSSSSSDSVVDVKEEEEDADTSSNSDDDVEFLGSDGGGGSSVCSFLPSEDDEEEEFENEDDDEWDEVLFDVDKLFVEISDDDDDNDPRGASNSVQEFTPRRNKSSSTTAITILSASASPITAHVGVQHATANKNKSQSVVCLDDDDDDDEGDDSNRAPQSNSTAPESTFRDVTVSTMPALLAEIVQLLNLLGVPFLVAAGESDVLCAALCRVGAVGGVLTEDSDCVVFGANSVARNSFSGEAASKQQRKKKQTSNDVALRTAPVASTTNNESALRCVFTSDLDSYGLTQPVLVTVAVLCGSDYCTGVPHMSHTRLLEILSSYSAAARLSVARHRRLSPDQQSLLPVQWWIRDVLVLMLRDAMTANDKNKEKNKKNEDDDDDDDEDNDADAALNNRLAMIDQLLDIIPVPEEDDDNVLDGDDEDDDLLLVSRNWRPECLERWTPKKMTTEQRLLFRSPIKKLVRALLRFDAVDEYLHAASRCVVPDEISWRTATQRCAAGGDGVGVGRLRQFAAGRIGWGEQELRSSAMERVLREFRERAQKRNAAANFFGGVAGGPQRRERGGVDEDDENEFNDLMNLGGDRNESSGGDDPLLIRWRYSSDRPAPRGAAVGNANDEPEKVPVLLKRLKFLAKRV